MKAVSRYVILSTLSLSLLSGCNDSSKSESPSEPPKPPVPGTETTVLYGPESKGLFQAVVMDSSGQTADIDADGAVNLGNISTTAIDDEEQGILRVNIKGGKPATFMTRSPSGQSVNIAGSAYQNGIYQFDLRVHDKAYANKSVKLQAAISDQLESAPTIDITGTVNALAGSGFQSIKVPADCFEQQGMDYKNSVIAFALTSESNLSFDIGNIRMIPFSTDASPLVNCNNNSETLTDLHSDVYRRWQGHDGGYVRSGWANNPSFNYPAEAHYPTEGGIGAKYPNADFGENGGLILNIKNDEPLKDISRFIETGVLSFDIKLVHTASHSGDMEIRMGANNDSDTRTVLITDLSENISKSLSIPVKKFFTHADGTMDIALAESINRAVIIQPAEVNSSDTLKGFEFVINNVSLDIIPPAGKCIPERH